MTLQANDRLGRYEILGPAGAGGMGEVYRARDTRLDRTVAVKVLPGDRTADEAARARFDREARSLSGLTHPNICALYDVGHERGIDYLVMEYLEGETLAARIEREGALPPAQLVQTGAQVAEALAVAHRQGFVHRDLKPANVMLTTTGAKLLDFGLAKPLEQQHPGAGLTATPTATSPLTAANSIVGTFQYMAPEQLEGKEADARSDIFALGAVLYEMATGRRPFDGDSHASIIASVMKEDPRPLSAIAPTSPPALDRLVQRCLAKKPDDRWQSASDLAHALRALEDGSGVVPASAIDRVAPAPASRAPWIVAAACGVAAVVLAVALVAALGGRSDPAADVRSPIRFQVAPPPEAFFRTTGDEAAPVAVSPDGRTLVFGTFEANGSDRLWIRSLDDVEPRPLHGTDHGIRPFWSPDGRFVGFFANGKLLTVEVAGGPALPLADVVEPRGGTWNDDGTIVYAPGASTGLMRIAATGGTPEPLTELAEGEGSHRYPVFLPDGRHVVFLVLTQLGASGSEPESDTRLFVVSLDGGAPRQLERGAVNAEYGDGSLVYYRGGQLVARELDLDPVALGPAQRILAADVQYDAAYERGLFSVSDRTLAYHGGGFVRANVVKWLDSDGTVLGEVTDARTTFDRQLSPDGRSVAYIAVDGNQTDVWIEGRDGDRRRRITFDGATKGEPQWSPDGRTIAYCSLIDGRWAVLSKPVSGSGDAEVVLTHDGYDVRVRQWSRDGRVLVLDWTGDVGNSDVWAQPVTLDGTPDGEPFPVVETPDYDERWPQVSPDGRWLAYTSNESGRWEIYVTSFPDARGKWQVSPGGGTESLWRGDGKALFYRSSGNAIMEADVSSADGRFDVESVSRLFTVFSTNEFDGSNYDVTADGRRFLVHTISEEQARAPITVVVGW